MTGHHALEITLTRSASTAELDRATHAMPLAANRDRTRLMTVARAKSPRRALHRVRRELDALLPIDVLSTHYPDHRGEILLNISLSHTDYATFARAAAARHQRLQDFLSQSITQALIRRERERSRQLTTALHHLLADHTPEELVAAAAQTLPSPHHPTP